MLPQQVEMSPEQQATTTAEVPMGGTNGEAKSEATDANGKVQGTFKTDLHDETVLGQNTPPESYRDESNRYAAVNRLAPLLKKVQYA